MKEFKAWYERQQPATNTVKTRVTIYNKYIKPNFDVGMTIVQFSGQVKKFKKLLILPLYQWEEFFTFT